MHHGVKGMKWGVRHDPERTGKRGFHPVQNVKRAGGFKQATKDGHASVRKERFDKLSPQEKKVKLAKQEYKQAKKQYNKDFNKWYGRSMAAYSPVKKHRQENNIRYQKAIVSSGEMAIKKGKYLQAKGSYKKNSKMISKGKYYVNSGTVASNYNKVFLSELNKGKSWKEANVSTATKRAKAQNQLSNIRKEYRNSK